MRNACHLSIISLCECAAGLTGSGLLRFFGEFQLRPVCRLGERRGRDGLLIAFVLIPSSTLVCLSFSIGRERHERRREAVPRTYLLWPSFTYPLEDVQERLSASSRLISTTSTTLPRPPAIVIKMAILCLLDDGRAASLRL